MSVDFTKMSFGKTDNASSSSKKDDKPKAQFWLNIGYQVEVPDDQGNEDRFVSLPQGIPLDTQETVSTKSKNITKTLCNLNMNPGHNLDVPR